MATTDIDILKRALNFETKRAPQCWDATAVGAGRADINRLQAAALIEVRARSSKIQTGVYGPALYRLTEKGRGLAADPEQPLQTVSAAEILTAMDLIVGFDDIKEQIAYCIEMHKRTHFLLEGPPASIHGDTEVWVDLGSGPECLSIASLEGKQFKALAVHPVSLQAGWHDAELSTHEYSGDWLEITGVGVLPFSVTATHSLVAYSPNIGCLVPKRADELKVGELLPINSNWQPRLRLSTKSQIFINQEPINLDKEFGFMLGFWLGDGGLCQVKNKLITFTNHKKAVLERIQNYLRGWNGKSTWSGGHLRRDALRVQHQPLFDFLKSAFLYGDGKPNVKGRTSRWKKLPPWVMQGPDDFVRELLNGYFYADGTVSNGVIYVTTTSPRLARDIAMLLTRFGICPAIQRRKLDARSVVIRQCDASKFIQEVGLFRENKNVSTSVLLHDESFKIPFPFVPEDAQGLTAALRKGRQSQSFTRRAATDLLYQPSWHNKLQKLIEADIRWVRVEHIRRYSEPVQTVYDLSVPEAETFMLGNRVLVHNCCKSVLLDALRSTVPGAMMVFGSRTSGKGLSDLLFEQKPLVLLMDEADKMRHDVFSLTLGLMEAGEIINTKQGDTRGIKLNTMVIAACNSSRKMPPEFLSRFAFHPRFPHYTRDEFIDVVRSMLSRTEQCPPELAEMIGRQVFDNRLGDVRQARGVWQLMREPTEAEAIRVLRMKAKYSTGTAPIKKLEMPAAMLI